METKHEQQAHAEAIKHDVIDKQLNQLTFSLVVEAINKSHKRVN
jgi:hypothetical protein